MVCEDAGWGGGRSHIGRRSGEGRNEEKEGGRRTERPQTEIFLLPSPRVWCYHLAANPPRVTEGGSIVDPTGHAAGAAIVLFFLIGLPPTQIHSACTEPRRSARCPAATLWGPRRTAPPLSQPAVPTESAIARAPLFSDFERAVAVFPVGLVANGSRQCAVLGLPLVHLPRA